MEAKMLQCHAMLYPQVMAYELDGDHGGKKARLREVRIIRNATKPNMNHVIS
jgi:hypothetical protein